MTWNPKINVFDPRPVITNIFNYIRANQTDALYLANNNAAGIPDIKEFYASPRTVTIFPSLVCIASEHSQKYDDTINIRYAATFECAIKHGDFDRSVEWSKIYGFALESMLTNMPETTFYENSIIDLAVGIDRLETQNFQAKQKQFFLQVFQTRAEWAIEAAAFND